MKRFKGIRFFIDKKKQIYFKVIYKKKDLKIIAKSEGDIKKFYDSWVERKVIDPEVK